MSAATPDRRRFPDPRCALCGFQASSGLRAKGGHGSIAFRWECRDVAFCRLNVAMLKPKEPGAPFVGSFVLRKRR